VTAILAMTEQLPAHLFSREAYAKLTRLVSFGTAMPATSVRLLGEEGLRSVELLVTGWGVEPIAETTLELMPDLRAIIHTGGGVDFIPRLAWERGIRVSSAASANAVPVAEFTVAMITLAGKDAFWISRLYGREQRPIDREEEFPRIGNYGRTVGIVGASQIGSRVLGLLASYDLELLLYDPYCSPERARTLGAELVPDLVALAARCTVLSVHAPSTPRTRGLISAEVLDALPREATVINTARAELIDQAAFLAELRSGRLRGIIDVTTPEVLPEGDDLYSLPNVFLTPHLAGAAGNELRRLGDSAIAEVERFVNGRPLLHEIPLARLASMR
jgi:phosphoglycerate dehydrogenase-like enzyme